MSTTLKAVTEAVRRYYSNAGIDTTVPEEGLVVTETGAEHGLLNLVRKVDEQGGPDAVDLDEVVRRMLDETWRTLDQIPSEFTPTVASQLRIQVTNRQLVNEYGGVQYPLWGTTDLTEALMLELSPTARTSVSYELIQKWGMPSDELEELARDVTRRAYGIEIGVHASGVIITSGRNAGYYAVNESIAGDHGLFVMVPDKSTALTLRTEDWKQIHTMSTLGYRLFTEQPHPVSRDLHWRAPTGTMYTAATFDETTWRYQYRRSAELTEVLANLDES